MKVMLTVPGERQVRKDRAFITKYRKGPGTRTKYHSNQYSVRSKDRWNKDTKRVVSHTRRDTKNQRVKQDCYKVSHGSPTL